MKIRFVWQVLYGTRVYAEGEVVEADEKMARHALSQGHAVEHVEPPKPAVRQATSAAPANARKATSR
jgi:hypothetical protein